MKAIHLKHYKVNNNTHVKTEDLNPTTGERISYVEYHVNKLYSSKMNINQLKPQFNRKNESQSESHSGSRGQSMVGHGQGHSQSDLERLTVNHAERVSIL